MPDKLGTKHPSLPQKESELPGARLGVREIPTIFSMLSWFQPHREWSVAARRWSWHKSTGSPATEAVSNMVITRACGSGSTFKQEDEVVLPKTVLCLRNINSLLKIHFMGQKKSKLIICVKEENLHSNCINVIVENSLNKKSYQKSGNNDPSITRDGGVLQLQFCCGLGYLYYQLPASIFCENNVGSA